MGNIKPLEGIKVVELSLMLAAPGCARMLADWGAEVVKVEDTGRGDAFRLWAASVNAPVDDDCNPMFDQFNANKKAISLNVKTEEGMKIMHKLLSGADVFITNIRPQALKGLRLDYENLKEKYPKLVVAQLFSYGEKGPDKDKPGYDNAAFWGRAGVLYSQAVFDGENGYPISAPMGFGDTICATAMLAAISSALVCAQRTGKGDRVSLSLYGTAMWMGNLLIGCSQFGVKYPKVRERMIPFGAPYLCADKRWFMPQVVDFYRDSPRFYKVIGAEDMMENPLYKDRNDFNKVEICGPVVARFEKIFATKTAKEWEALFIANDLSCEILATYEDTLVDEQAIVNNYVYNMKYKNGREIKLIRPPLYSDNLGLPEYNPAPMLGENTVEILKGLDYSDEKIKKLLEAKVVKQHD